MDVGDFPEFDEPATGPDEEEVAHVFRGGPLVGVQPYDDGIASNALIHFGDNLAIQGGFDLVGGRGGGEPPAF